jgi:tetratricopeptide (TPR) repeat protein
VSASLARSNPDNRTAQRGLGFGYNALGGYLAQLGRSREAIEALDQAAAIRLRLCEADPGNSSNLNDLSITHLRLADAHAGLEDFDRALEHLDSARAHHLRLPESDRESPQHMGNLAAIQATSGMTLRQAADAETDAAVRGRERREALGHYQAALDLFARMEAQGSSIELWRDDIALIEREMEALRAAIGAGTP